MCLKKRILNKWGENMNENYWKLQGTIRKLKEKDNKCFICGSTENIVPHHIKQVKNNSEEYYDKNNLVLLCDYHHRKYHNQYCEVNAKTFGEFLMKNHSKNPVKKNKPTKIDFVLDKELKMSKMRRIIKALNKTSKKVVKISFNGKLYDISRIYDNENYTVLELGDFELTK